MLRPRVIVSLLIENGRLVKTIKFGSTRYIGDPLNAVRIYNEKFCDELIVYDIAATPNNTSVNFELLSKFASVSNMPLCYGGGIKEITTAEKLVNLGFEKISISSEFLINPNIVTDIAKKIGSQSVVVTLNVLKHKSLFNKKYFLKNKSGDAPQNTDPLSAAQLAVELGAGEIVFNCVDMDGVQKGYDLDFVKQIKDRLTTPVSFLGGCGELSDMTDLLKTFGHCGCAAGSKFIYKGKLNGILINYPDRSEKLKLVDT